MLVSSSGQTIEAYFSKKCCKIQFVFILEVFDLLLLTFIVRLIIYDRFTYYVLII